MKLCDLLENVSFQGNIEIRMISPATGDTIIERYFDNVSELYSCDVRDWEDYNVVCVYSDSFHRKYPHNTVTLPYLIIEIEKPEEIA